MTPAASSSAALRAVILSACLLAAGALPCWAQNQVRVTSDRVTVWRPGFTVIAFVAKQGEVLEVVGRRGNWYEIVVPGPELQARTTGFIAVTRVEVVSGSLPPSTVTEPRAQSSRRQVAEPPPLRSAPQPTTTRARATPKARDSWRAFAQGGYGWFSAHDSFTAVLGKSQGMWWGGGVRYETHRYYFVEGVAEHFQANGQRAFVFDNAVYPLGIADRVLITPVMAHLGVQVPRRRFTAYAGGGIGAYLLRETSDFADASDNVKQHTTAYRALAGVQWQLGRAYGAGLDVQYTTVPHGLSSGAAAAFNESNAGGVQVRVRILFGR